MAQTIDTSTFIEGVFKESTTQNFEQSLRDNKRDGYLQSERINGEKGYKLTPSGIKHIKSLMKVMEIKI